MSLLTAVFAMTLAALTAQNDAETIAALDTAYQAAVEHNDAPAMAKILHPDMTLVLGDGTVVSRAQLIASARDRHNIFEIQVEEPGTQTVRLYGEDTATVTALLRLKGASAAGKAFDRRLWFTDTYVRTPDGWRYAFGQASTALPPK